MPSGVQKTSTREIDGYLFKELISFPFLRKIPLLLECPSLPTVQSLERSILTHTKKGAAGYSATMS